MSNDFWSTLNKKKKEELLKSTQTKQSSTTREETKSSDFWSVLNEDKKKELLSSATTNDAPMRTFMSDDDDIAPVVSSSSERASFFTKGGLSDGYDKWDVSKTVAGTVGDVLLTAAQGVGNMAEGLVDLGAYGVAGVSNILGADDFAKKAKDFAKKNHVDEVVEENQDLMGLNDYSVLGKYPRMVGNGVGQILGTVATAGLGKLGSLGKIGSTILTSGVIGASGMGSGMSEAYSMGATDDKATAYGASVGAIEVISELLFGGLGKGFNSLGLSKGLTSIDDVVAKKLSNTAAKFITSEAGQKVVGNALEYTVKSGAEGLEEVISGFGSAIAKDAYLMNEEDEKAFLEILEDENLLEQFVIGSIVSGFAQGGDVINATKNGRDFVSGLSKNEQTVVDKVYEQRLAEESENRTLTNRDKNNLYDRIVNEMKRGYVTTDEIESILGGETYKGYKDLTDKKTSLEERKTAIEEEIKSLIKTPETQYSLREEAKGIDDFLANPGIDEAKNKLFNEVNKLTAKDTYLRESYNDLLRKEQAIDIDENQYKGTKFEDAAKKTIENARKAGANNSNRVRDFVNFSAKYSSVSGTVVDFTDKVQINKMLEDQIKSQISELQTSTVTEDKKKLAELQKMLKQVQEGKIHVNGIKTKDGVAINLESPNYLNTILGHEVTHFLEGKNGYEALQKAIFKHAQNKGDYEGRRKALEALYKNIDGTTVDYELTADLVGDYLFTDYDFIKNLSTENRNVFQQIYDQVKYMFKLATAGSKEARELEKVMHQFEKVLRESTQEGEKVDGKTQFSIKATEDGTKYVKLDGNIFLKEDGTEMSPTEAYNALVGKKITLEDGDVITFIKKLPDRNVYKELFKKLPGYEEGIDVKAISESINKNIVEVITASEAQTRNEAQRHPHIGIKDFDQREVFIADDSDAYRLELCIANLTDGTKIAYVKRYIERASQEISEKIKKAETAEQIRLNQPSVDAEGIETNDTTSTNDIIAQFPENVNTQNSVSVDSEVEKGGVSYDKKSESYSPTRFSLSTWNKSDYVTERNEAASDMAKALGITEEKATQYIDSVNSIAKMVADDKARLDYEASPGRSAFVSNAEYGGSIDFSTICKKRRLFTGTFEAIQNALPNTALTAEEVLEIRKMMKDKGYEVSCGLCYVEGSRANMGQFTKQFIERYKATNPKYVPNMAEMNTATGQEQIRKEHPEVYEAYEYFMNHYGKLSPDDNALFASQQKPKMYQMATEYNSEILDKFGGQASSVAEKNKNGGLRLQSFSDFEIIHLIDSMQVIMDMSRVGLAGQAYTKVPDFAWALGDTGLKINLSLIAKDVDANGRLVLDEVEGMKESDAMNLRNRYSDNVGTILVAFNDEQLKAAMADERIDYIIPYHRSQWKTSQYESMGLPENTKDYTSWQNESYIEPVYNKNGKKQRPDNYMPNTYWDFNKSGKENAERYLQMCADNNRRPKFSHLLVDNGDGSYSLQPDGSTDGYWKTLIDFKMYNNDGMGVPQKPVTPDFNMEEAQRMLNEYTGGHAKFPVANDIVEEFVSKHPDNIAPAEVKHSLSYEGEKRTLGGSYRFNGKDFKVKSNQDIAPVAENAPKQTVEDTTFDAPMFENIPILPDEELEQGTIAAIRPKPEKQQSLKKVNNAESEEHIAQVLTEEPKVEKKKTGIIKRAIANLIDKGAVFENLSLKTKNRALQDTYKAMGRSETKAQYFMENGTKGIKSLDSIREEVEQTGKTKEFYEYLYHKLNIDRMSLESKEQPNLERLKGEMKKLKLDKLQENQLRAIASEKITEETAQKRADLIKTVREYLASKDVKNKPVFDYSVTSEMSQDKAKELESANPNFKEYAQDVYNYMNHLRKMMVDKGVISQETADLWSEMYPHYVPIRRVGHEGVAVNVPLDTGRTGINAPIKKATGGNSDILPLFETMAQRTSQTFKAIDKNSFGVELKNTLGNVVESTKTNIDEVIDSIDAHESLLQEGKNGKNPTFTVFEGGERVTFEITDEMYDALKPTSEGWAATIKPLNTASNLHRAVLTEYSVPFIVTNAVKDAQDVLINSQHPVKTYAKFPTAIQELTTKGKWYTEYMENGGGDNTYFDKKTNTFNKEKSQLRKIFGFPFDKISDANNFIEKVPRLAEYIASRESGASIDAAMLDAARVTTDFSAGGDVTKFFNRNGATFLNASVQGAAQQVRNWREAKMNGLKGWVGLATKYAIAGLPALLLNHLLWEDDEEYEELSDYVKENYYVVAKYGDGKFVRIPKGRTVAVIQNAFEQISNTLTGDDEADWGRFWNLFWSNLAPNDPSNNNILAPIKQVMTNKTWYGEDLVPSRLQDLPAAEQYDESTDAISKWLGENINVSPYKINYLLNQYSGGVGDIFLPMMTPEAESGDNSLVGNFVAPLKDKFTTDSVMNNQNVSDFYDTVDVLTKNAKSSYATDEDILKNKYINSVSTELGDLYKAKREIQNSNLSDSVKYAQVRSIQDQINNLAKNALNSYESVNIQGGYATVGDKHYRLDDGVWTKISDKQLERQQEVTNELGISPSEYWSKTDISYFPNSDGEFEYAYDNPEKYAVSKLVGGYDTYKTYSKELYSIKADKDESGKSITGSRKEKVLNYINNLDADYETKIILWKSEYPSDDTYNMEIINYINNRTDLTYEERVAIFQELGFTVSNGSVYWD